MPIDKEQFLKQFVKQALDERISLFLGAGGSCDAGYPNWADLFAPFARDLGTPIGERIQVITRLLLVALFFLKIISEYNRINI